MSGSQATVQVGLNPGLSNHDEEKVQQGRDCEELYPLCVNHASLDSPASLGWSDRLFGDIG